MYVMPTTPNKSSPPKAVSDGIPKCSTLVASCEPPIDPICAAAVIKT